MTRCDKALETVISIIWILFLHCHSCTVDYEFSKEKNLALSYCVKLVISACSEKPRVSPKIVQSSLYCFFNAYSQLHMQHDHLLMTKWDLKTKSEKSFNYKITELHKCL